MSTESERFIIQETYLRRGRRGRRGLALALSGALVAAACGGGDTDSDAVQASAISTVATAPSAESPATSTSVATEPIFKFDDLGASYPDIFVYPNPDTKPPAIEKLPAYNDDEEVLALCRRNGRPMNSDVSLGEPEAYSKEWVKLGGPAIGYWATEVYGDVILPPGMTELRECDPNE